jgi:hypothetical protein
VVDPEASTVSVYHRSGTFRSLTAADNIDLPELLGDWHMPVTAFFE